MPSATELERSAEPKSSSKKDRADKQARKSKKRQREEQSQQNGTTQPHDEPLDSPSKPNKKRRKSDKQDTEPQVDRVALSAFSPHKSQEPETIPSTAQPETPSSSSLIPQPSPTSAADTPFTTCTASLLLPLAPPAFSFALPGLCAEHLSPLLLTYYPPLSGIVLSYSNPRVSDSPAHQAPPYVPPPSTHSAHDPDEDGVPGTQAPPQPAIQAYAAIHDEYAPPFVWVTADFLLLRVKKRPRATLMTGTVQVQNPSWLGLVCWNYFSAGINAKRLPKSWRWVEGHGDAAGEVNVEDETGEGAALGSEGYWVDESGQKVQGEITFRVRDFETTGTSEGRGLFSFEGTLLNDEEEKAADLELKELRGERRDKRRKGKGREVDSAA